jgi:hypothetical protein
MDMAETRGVEGKRSEQVLGASSVLEGAAGAAAVVLPILGLLGVLPTVMASVGAIVIGGALFAAGSAMGTRYSELMAKAGGERQEVESLGGLGIEVLGGAAGVVLGILSLVGISSMVLLEVSTIVLGGTLMLGAGATARLNDFRAGLMGMTGTGREVAREAVNAGAATQMLAGAGAVVLGILALAGVGGAATALTLVLTALLAMGGGILVAGSASAGRMLTLARHHG